MSTPGPGQRQEIDFNCFELDGTIDLSVCRKVGFKNAQARKAWHGMFGWTSEFNCIGYELSFPGGPGSGCTGPTCGSGCNCLWQPYQGTPSVNRYLNWNVHAHVETIQMGVTTSFATLDRTVSINRFTGCQTVVGCSDNYSDLGTFNGLQNTLVGNVMIDPCSLGHSSYLPPKGSFSTEQMLAFFRPLPPIFECTLTTSATRIGCEPQYICQTHDIVDPGHPLIAELSVDAIAGTAHFKNWDISGNPICEIDINVSETVSYFNVHGWTYSGGSLISEAFTTITNTLSNPYTSDDLYSDVLGLISRIDLSNDTQYPWRTDGYISVAPLETYDELPPSTPDPATAIATMCPVSSDQCLVTGTIMGDLLPAGYGPNFAWNHITWRCCQGDFGNLESYRYAYGAWAHTPPDSPIPPFTFTTCPPAVCPGGQIPVTHFVSSSGVITFYTDSAIPGWDPSAPQPVAICGTNAIDGIYNISPGSTPTPPFSYSVINPQINNAPFQPACQGGVVGVVNINRDVTFYTVGDATDLAMPPTATQWTENRYGGQNQIPLTAGDMPGGAWIIYTNGYLFAQKWAEIKVHRPSYNFARPCGIDKWMLDETKVTCVIVSDGAAPPTLQIYQDLGLVSGDFVYVAGMKDSPTVPDGVYQVQVIDSTHIKLNLDCTMRKILSVTQTGMTTVAVVMSDPMVTIKSGDNVDIVGIAGLGPGLPVNVTDSTHFTVPGTLIPPFGTQGYAFVSGEKAYQPTPTTIDFNPGDDSNGIVGKIRLITVPGICGRISVSAAVQNGTKVGILTGSPHYLQQGDFVDFTGVAGLGSNVAVTVIDSSTIEVVGTLSTPYSGGGFVNSYGAADYQWNDDQSKGNFLYAEFTYNFRDYQEADFMCQQYHGGSYSVCGQTQTGCNLCAEASPGFTCIEVSPGVWESDVRQFQAVENGLDRAITNFTIDELCLPFDPCNPQIMAVVPPGSSENFPQPSVVAFFPDTFVSDWKYGSRWQGFYTQNYFDLLAQKPHVPCLQCDCEGCVQIYIPQGCPQAQDDGSCQQDTCQQICTSHTGTSYYAHLPLVEALQDIPSGAPTPPIGHIGFPTYEQLSTLIVDPSWPRLSPPSGLGYGLNAGSGGVDPCLPAVLETPWTLAINQWLCICSNGRFKQQYIDNGQSVNCPSS